MKKIFYLLLASVGMTSCSQNEIIAEVTPPAPTPIVFATQFGNSVASSTRAGLVANLDTTISLGVFAFSGIPSQAIYDNINDMRMRYVPAKREWFLNPEEHYYPANDSTVTFWAYGPKGNTHLQGISCDTIKGPKFYLDLRSTDIGPTAVDIFATQAKEAGKLSTASVPITFTLKHLLAQVKFLAKTKTQQDADNYDVKIYDIAINTKGRAKYTYHADEDSLWTNHIGDSVTWKPVDEDDTQAVLTKDTASIGELVSLIPGQKTTITVKARIYKKNQSAVVVEQIVKITLDNAVGKPAQAYLKAGSIYTYTIIVEPKVGKIYFTAPQITDWLDRAGDIEIPQPPVAPPAP